MARPIESQLYRELVGSCFQFIERGEREINDIYESVKHEFPELCDDEYLCPHKPYESLYNYEWKHSVRSALQSCKIKCDNVSYSGRRGYWIFS